MLKLIAIAFFVLLFLIAAMVVIGYSLPKSHVVARAISLHQKPEVVFALISNFKDAASWRPEVKQVEILPSSPNAIVFREISKHSDLTMEATQIQPPGRLVTQITGKDLPFGGVWIYEITSTAEGCRLNITERGEIYNPFFRFMSRFFLGYNGTLETYLQNVRAKFAETSPVEPGTPGSL